MQWQPSSSLTQWVRMPKLDIYIYHLGWVLTSELMFDMSRLHICHELEAFSICYVCQWDSVGAVCQGLCSRHFAYVLSSSQHPARFLSNIKGEAMMALAKVTESSRRDLSPDLCALKPMFPSTTSILFWTPNTYFTSKLQGGYHVMKNNEAIGTLFFHAQYELARNRWDALTLILLSTF